MDAKAFRAYVARVRLILLLSALLSAIAGYTPVAAARPVEAGQVLQVAQQVEIAAAARPANSATPAPLLTLVAAHASDSRPLYADRLLI